MVVLVATSAGCARAEALTGAATTLYGVTMLASADNGPSCQQGELCYPNPGGFFEAVGRAMFGTALVVAGLAMTGGGIMRMAAESREQQATVPTPLAMLGDVAHPAGPARPEPPADDEPAPPPDDDAPSDQLLVQLGVAAHAGHCRAAAAIGRQLAARDAERVVALIQRDSAVAHCLAYRM